MQKRQLVIIIRHIYACIYWGVLDGSGEWGVGVYIEDDRQTFIFHENLSKKLKLTKKKRFKILNMVI